MPTTPNEINCGEKILEVLLVRLILYASFLVVEDKRSPQKQLFVQFIESVMKLVCFDQPL